MTARRLDDAARTLLAGGTVNPAALIIECAGDQLVGETVDIAGLRRFLDVLSEQPDTERSRFFARGLSRAIGLLEAGQPERAAAAVVEVVDAAKARWP
jgi:hypothetical protein